MSTTERREALRVKIADAIEETEQYNRRSVIVPELSREEARILLALLDGEVGILMRALEDADRLFMMREKGLYDGDTFAAALQEWREKQWHPALDRNGYPSRAARPEGEEVALLEYRYEAGTARFLTGITNELAREGWTPHPPTWGGIHQDESEWLVVFSRPDPTPTHEGE